ncbi:hypothetical protein K443DRAFT_5862 [Laccaria amethystina LaAM-08-1]|uniref:Uncharacterized protein n=1 Tax=Laccaria amethystina LaAM-08-1 TaxID=1095629 RepID=A0A0C9XD97_9AGAR|nr:hypothetical protein K443DRAFT_5862 [Laccaria amethystina LaAM-08-1]
MGIPPGASDSSRYSTLVADEEVTSVVSSVGVMASSVEDANHRGRGHRRWYVYGWRGQRGKSVFENMFLMDELHHCRIFWHLHLFIVLLHLLLPSFLLNLPPTSNHIITRRRLLPIPPFSHPNLPTPPAPNHILPIQHLHSRENLQRILNTTKLAHPQPYTLCRAILSTMSTVIFLLR